jgi:outer membrane biosynthesis protein TonB
MSVFDTQHKRKSAVITSVILAALLLIIFNYGMSYFDPPKEYGIAINYGVSDVGRSKPKIVEKVKTTPKPPVQEEKVEEEVVKEEVPKEVTKEEVITTEKKEAPVIEKPKKEEKKEEPKEEVKEEKPKPKPKPKKPSEDAKKAFDNLLNGDKSDGEPKGEGDDDKDGLKGKEDGDPKSPNFYGNKGSTDGDPNYSLAGRRALTKPKEQPDCLETGIVVVSIEVDKTGKVIKATPGVKGSTNTAKCLLDPARKAAMNTTWTAAANAPSKQVGTITYNFTVTE